jgi:hypothetical protein
VRFIQIVATALLAMVLAAAWAAIVWLLVTTPAVLAIAGLAYAIAAFGLLLQVRAPDAQEKFEQDVQDIRREISSGGIRGLTLFLARPLFHFAMLPNRSVTASVALGAALAVPWLIVR